MAGQLGGLVHVEVTGQQRQPEGQPLKGVGVAAQPAGPFVDRRGLAADARVC
jgi:hypothetical protein